MVTPGGGAVSFEPGTPVLAVGTQRAVLRANACGDSQKVSLDVKVVIIAHTTRVPHSQETAPPCDPAVGLCLGPYGVFGVVKVSYVRGTPVVN